MFFLIIIGLFVPVASQLNTEIEVIKSVIDTFNKNSFFILTGFDKTDNIEIISRFSHYGFQTGTYSVATKLFPSINPLQDGVFILKYSSNESLQILNHANEENLFAFPLKWIIINDDFNTNLTKVLNALSNYNILVDSYFIFICKEFNNNYLLYKFYKRLKTDTKLVLEEFAIWNNSNGLIIIEKESITAVRRQNLMGIVLRNSIVVTHNDTLNHLKDYRDKHIDSITKVNYVLVEHLANFVNISLNYSIQSTWGYKTNTSTWTGMIGELIEDKADIGGTALFVTSDRITIIDYITMPTPTKSFFVFRQPKLSYVTNVFTLPFHWTVWISSIALVIIITMILYIILKWENKTTKLTDPSWNLEAEDSMIMTFGAVCQQGASQLPEKASGRIITLFTFISLMFLYTSYSANIVALLQSSSNSIKTLEDLLKSRLDVGVDDTVFNRFYFPAATEPIRKALYEEKVAPKNEKPRFYPIEEGIKKIRKGLFAFHVETGSGYKIIGETFYEDEKCGLQEIEFLQVPDPWLAIQKNSSYKEILKIGLRKIHESGLQSREVSRIYTKKPKCSGTANSFISVGLIDIYAAIVVFAIGLIISSLIFLLEFIIFKKLSQRHSKYK